MTKDSVAQLRSPSLPSCSHEPESQGDAPRSGPGLGRRRFLQVTLAGALGLGAIRRRGPLTAGDPASPGLPRATLMLMGGGVPELGVDELRQLPIPAAPAQCDPSGLFRELLTLTPVRQPVVECVTSADEDDPRRLGEQHRRVLAALGISAVDFLGPLDPREADRDASLAERVRRADIVLLCGGDQSLLKSRFGGTAACHVLRDRYWNDDRFVLAGNSAGAMILADEMITGDGPRPETGPSMGTGWHFVNGSVDTHVGPRRRRRLGKAVRRSRSGFGIGVTTQAALVLRPDSARVYGGPVIVVRRYGESDSPRAQASLPPAPNVTGCEAYARDGLAATIYQPGEALAAEDRMRVLRPRG